MRQIIDNGRSALLDSAQRIAHSVVIHQIFLL